MATRVKRAKRTKRTKRVAQKEKFTRWDPVNHLRSEEDIAAYLEAAFEEAGDEPAFIAIVLGDIARARGIMAVAEAAGMSRAGVYKALAPDGNPTFKTLHKISKAMGIKLVPKAA